jgi:hypothetical protein
MDEVIGVIYPLSESNFNILKIRAIPTYIKFIYHSNSKNSTKLHK